MFNIFRRKLDRNNTNNIKVDYSKCIEIAKIISNNNLNVTNEVTECVNNPIKYFQFNKKRYEDRCIYNADNIDIIIWIGMVDILINNNYACERDWKDELEDFTYFMNDLKTMKENNIKINKELLNQNEEDAILEWCEYLKQKDVMKNFVIGAIDIDSDSFIMFVCLTPVLDKLKILAESVNHRIDFASNM